MARNSRFTWWTMPTDGGTTRKLSRRLLAPSEKLVPLAIPLELQLHVARQRLRPRRSDRPAPSDRSPGRPGTSGLIFAGLPPSRAIALRIAARSTTQGTPVKSCSTTRAGLKGISTAPPRRRSTRPACGRRPRSPRIRRSSAAPTPAAARIEYGRAEIRVSPASSSTVRRYDARLAGAGVESVAGVKGVEGSLGISHRGACRPVADGWGSQESYPIGRPLG